jgi:hypothetical protein
MVGILLSAVMMTALLGEKVPLGAEEIRTVTVAVSADSQHAGYEAWRTMDGKTSTIWHTEFGGSGGSSNPEPPHQIQVNLKKAYPLKGFVLTPRQDIVNGNFSRFMVYISNDPKNLGSPVLEVMPEKPQAVAKHLFDAPVSGQYFTLRTFDEVQKRPWSSLAELELLSDGVRFVSGPQPPVPDEILNIAEDEELLQQYAALCDNMKQRQRREQYADQVFLKDAMILPADRDPADIVYRRTAALWNDMKPQTTHDFSETLEQLREKVQTVDPADVTARYSLYEKLCHLRRQIAFVNPLLDFSGILFVKRHRATFNHMCDQYYGINSVPGGGVYLLSQPFGGKPEVRDVLENAVVQNGRLKGTKLENGTFVTPALSYDAQKLAFAFVECQGDKKQRFHTDVTRGHWDEKDCYHIFTVNMDGTGLTQLTDGTWNDFDPCWLPNNRMAFITERRGGYLRCGRECPNYTLFDMDPDGGRMRCLSYHETNEWDPTVTHDGKILYTRWDYVDRHGCTAHHPWITTLDGRDSRTVHGNFALRSQRSDMEVSCKAIPGSPKYISTAAPHHGQAYGSLVMIDPRVEDDNVMAPVKRITPDVDFPESQGGSQTYGTPWPLSEKYYLAVADLGIRPDQGAQGSPYSRGNYGVYLIDAFGNKELLYRDPEIASLAPIPVKPREVPPVAPQYAEMEMEHQPYVVPKRGDDAPAAVISIVNVNDSWVPLPKDAKIKELRVLQIIPMSVPSGKPPHEVGLREPTSMDSVVLPRYVLGTVPVEADGSVHMTVPAQKEILFQLIDENGLAVQSMRSATYLQPNETLVCEGCHEQRHRAPLRPDNVPLAMRRAPSKPVPDAEGSNPFSYPRLVQPVLDRHCVSCHSPDGEAAPNLAREPIKNHWYASYVSLVKDYGFYSYGNPVVTKPEAFGAKTAKLYHLLKNGHYDVKLSEEELHRLTLWLDCCSIFYGVYEKEGGLAQLQGDVVLPTLE